MPLSQWFLVLLSLTELLLLLVLALFFWRLRRSEAVVNELQRKQEEFVSKLHFNAELEQELVASFQERQRQLGQLDDMLAAKIKELRGLVARAERMCRTTDYLRDLVIRGRREGRSVEELADVAGLSVDEVELILMKAGE
ncbi:MAG: hypothetical protein H0S85_16570 [Desulfovibrionaceae bacterium]|jgi:uncharacterized protein HemX|nr:hypothetical protein [Desulfovibrionaceae bacterium]